MGFFSKFKATPATDWEAKFKAAITDLADEVEASKAAEQRIERLVRDGINHADRIERLRGMLVTAESEIAALRPDAEKWRDRAARELQRGQAKRDAAAKVLPVSKFTKPIPTPTKAVAAKGRGK